jgi:hypothetical protein
MDPKSVSEVLRDDKYKQIKRRIFMGITSNKAKQRWKKENCTQVNVAVSKDVAAAFKAKCITDGVSIASEISRFMSRHCGDNAPVNKKPEFRFTTRPQRRKSLYLLISHIEELLDAETEYKDNIPENLQNSCRYEAADQAVAALEEALDILNTVFE